MEPNKILSANILDLIFDDRNKEYGAYELRRTYSRRITKALLITGLTAAMAFAGAVLANSIKPDERTTLTIKELTLEDVDQQKQPDPLPEPERKPEPVEVRTERLTIPQIVDDKDVPEPVPTQEDLVDAKISDIKQDGVADDRIVDEKVIDDGKGIIDEKKVDPDIIHTTVEIPARFDGSWEKFLTRNLNANVPVDNGAPAGTYKIIIQFVVDKEGNLSDIKPMTELGYGMEQEAIRVLKKAKGWKPGIQNGHEVRSYHKQPITFEVVEEN